MFSKAVAQLPKGDSIIGTFFRQPLNNKGRKNVAFVVHINNRMIRLSMIIMIVVRASGVPAFARATTVVVEALQ